MDFESETNESEGDLLPITVVSQQLKMMNEINCLTNRGEAYYPCCHLTASLKTKKCGLHALFSTLLQLYLAGPST